MSNPVASFSVSKCLQGVSNQEKLIESFKKPLKRLPISREILHKMIDAIPRVIKNTYLAHMFKTLFLLCYYASLRAGEAVKSNNLDNVLRMNNFNKVSLNGKPGYRIDFENFKHSKYPTSLSLISSGSKNYCPVIALDKYIKMRGGEPGYLFLKSNRKLLTRAHFSTTLRSCLNVSGYQYQLYNTHSFRIGRTTDLALLKFPEAVIKASGRWKSDAYKKYIKLNPLRLPC